MFLRVAASSNRRAFRVTEFNSSIAVLDFTVIPSSSASSRFVSSCLAWADNESCIAFQNVSEKSGWVPTTRVGFDLCLWLSVWRRLDFERTHFWVSTSRALDDPIDKPFLPVIISNIPSWSTFSIVVPATRLLHIHAHSAKSQTSLHPRLRGTKTSRFSSVHRARASYTVVLL